MFIDKVVFECFVDENLVVYWYMFVIVGKWFCYVNDVLVVCLFLLLFGWVV